MNKSNIKLVATDLDGTLLRNDRTISGGDIETLQNLGKNGVFRVAVTGRSLFLVESVLKHDFPFDYVIFSSGAGIINWQSKELIFTRIIQSEKVEEITSELKKRKLEFSVHAPVPENHKFKFYCRGESHEYLERVTRNPQLGKRINGDGAFLGDATQFIVQIPKLSLLEELTKFFHDTSIIRATSPIDDKSIWMEIFPTGVHKGEGLDWLCKKLEVEKKNTLSIGNDYNDIDMLRFTKKSYVVENSPLDLKKEFEICKSNMESGFTDAVIKGIK